MANRSLLRDRPCAQCGTNPIAGYKFCSDECFQKHLYARRSKIETFKEYNRQKVAEHKARQVASRAPVVCKNCNSEFHGKHGRRVFCSDVCGQEYAAFRSKVDPPSLQICPECKCEFLPSRAGIVFCSIACQKKARRRKNDPIRRARKRNATIEKFDPLEILERDNWICYICGVKTNPQLRGSYDHNAPELDHIVPLAAGGDHSRENTACACRQCNNKKSDKPLFQVRLIK
jgi:5-methylcytosine-specific restriction endonuclease McrA